MGPEDDLRGDIESALSTAEDSPGDSVGTPDSGDGGTPAPETPPEGTPPADPKPEGSALVRDSMGRFLPKAEKAPGGAAAAPGTPGATAPVIGAPAAPQAPSQAIQPPYGWSFGAKEAWAQVPVAAQQEIARRETQMQQWAQDTAPARQLGERFHQAVQPFMPAIQAEGVDPLTAVTNLMQFATRMRMGTPNEKAQTLATIIKTYGVDIQSLDNALVGQPLPQQQQGTDPQYVQQAVQQALAPLYQAAQQRHQQVQQQAETATRSELEQFAADPKNKYFPDLRVAMADMIEVAQRQGFDMSLADAYERAAFLHPEISKVMIAQRQGASAHQLTAAAQRARAAAVSVTGSAPIGNPNVAEPTSIRESIEAAIEAHSRY